ncbi:hypothetical protein ABF87_00715 [Nitrosomonas sp. JL21]|uniref:hypothetical protein n=1 Tax=Nitrosomonas sp. JL21 TaxID=153949 RepID=UPI001370F04F|nr:hypothetical protein [Nitrosomonas sp. JL21]MBL8496765.1 hypothetical protein [Nitrosomonas sp.]MXS76497.1 hypothetical protein [Nitrosomonas sp. JL21]
MRNSEPESSGLNFNLIMPAALLLVLLIVPFSINSFLHFMSGKRPSNPVVMKLPVDSAVVTMPSSARQYESFDVALNLETKHLVKFLNELITTASEGTSILGITGVIAPNMRAEILGEDFEIDRTGPLDPVSVYGGTASWRWRVTPESSGDQVLKFQLHLLTKDDAQVGAKILELAEANVDIQSNWSEGLKRHWYWIVLLLLVPLAIFVRLRRHAAQ